MYIYIYTRIYIYNIHICICIYIYIHIHIHIYIYIHTRSYTSYIGTVRNNQISRMQTKTEQIGYHNLSIQYTYRRHHTSSHAYIHIKVKALNNRKMLTQPTTMDIPTKLTWYCMCLGITIVPFFSSLPTFRKGTWPAEASDLRWMRWSHVPPWDSMGIARLLLQPSAESAALSTSNIDKNLSQNVSTSCWVSTPMRRPCLLSNKCVSSVVFLGWKGLLTTSQYPPNGHVDGKWWKNRMADSGFFP